MDEAQLTAHVLRAAEARKSAPMMDIDDIPESVLEKVQAVRVALDEVETILISLTAARSTSRFNLSKLRIEFEDAWDKAMLVSRDKHLSDYSTAKEKEAEANTDTIELRASFRTAERNHQKLDDSRYIVSLCKESLDRLRQDLLAHHRAFTLEDNISR